MAWTSPMTAVANSAFTAAQFNQFVRDNFNESAAAKATVSGALIVTTGPNAITTRKPTAGSIDTAETTASTSYTDLTTPGPVVTITTGTSAIVVTTSRFFNASSVSCYMSHAVSGASTLAESDTNGLIADPGTGNQVRMSAVSLRNGDLTAGSNTFTAKYRVDGGSGQFAYRKLLVIPL